MVDLIERLAAHAHEQWSGWMRYLFSKSTENPDGTVTIPKWAVDRWRRQVATAYHDLPEQEKESDRDEGRSVLAVVDGKADPQFQLIADEGPATFAERLLGIGKVKARLKDIEAAHLAGRRSGHD